VTDPLKTFEGDLDKLATPAGTPQPVLTVAGDVLSLLADTKLVGTPIGGAVSAVYKAIGTAINGDVVTALQAIAEAIATISVPTGVTVTDVASALNSLQNVLQTAQSLVPGGSSAAASALASTSQFATLFGNLLTDAGSVTKAADTLNTIALQLGAVGTTFTTAAAGNP
jgi:hypothetical protein